MGVVKGSSKVCHLIGLLFILNCGFCAFAQANRNEGSQIYVVHIGERQHDDPDLVAQSHQEMLESVFESAEAARESIIYNYHHGFSGFAAKLTKWQAKKLAEHPDVFRVNENHHLKLQGTRVSEYMGILPSIPKGILQESDMGSELVLGLLDTGIWPEAEAFNDKGLGPIPKHWKGECVAGQDFDPAKHCNRKLVGAKYFLDGYEKKNPGETFNNRSNYLSVRSKQGHGTACASLGAGTFVPNVSYVGGLARGVFRGVAPKARIAMYKVVWDGGPYMISFASMYKAFDEAIKDKVDVLSVSIGATAIPIPPLLEDDFQNDLEFGSFHAVQNGIPVVAAAGNSGPGAYSVVNVAPWLLTVGGTSIDRTFHVDMTFGNNITMQGQAPFGGNETSADLIYIENLEDEISLQRAKGKFVLTFVEDPSNAANTGVAIVMNAGAAGVILARSSDVLIEAVNNFDPMLQVDFEVGYKILRYIRSSSSPTVKLSRAKTFVGRPLASTVSGFSSRGPSSISPAILKPDVVAPGMMMLGSYIDGTNTYVLGQGTSFAAPIVAGIVVLLKALHPDWSPAALKSAIMTTAWRSDPSGEPLFSEDSPRKLADTFDYGAGLVNAERAKDPGLVYDMNIDDYIHYFCASGYNESSITTLTGIPTKCSSPLPSILDVNYPAITIPDLKGEVTLTRTVTNVGPVDSVYKAVIDSPEGVKVVVEPETLVFNSSKKILGFKVRVSSSYKCDSGYFFGSFTWTDGTRNVTIPLTVRPRA